MTHPVVLISGGEDFLADREVLRIVRAIKAADPSCERRDVEADAESGYAQFIDAVSPGLFGETAAVVVDSIETASDALQNAVLELINDDSNLVQVLLIQRGLVKGRGFIDKIKKSKAETVVFEKLKGKAFDDFLVNEFKSFKRKITTDATKQLRQAVGDDLAALAAAVSQLCSDVDSNPIEASDIEKYYEGMAGVSGFVVSDAMFEGRVSAAITALRWAVERDPNVGPAVIATAVNSLRGLIAVHGAPSGVTEADLARIAGIPPWKVRSVRDTLKHWRPTAMADAALLLTRADAALKGGEIDELGRIHVLEPIQRQALLERTIVEIARSR